jgi:hypothetical protein
MRTSIVFLVAVGAWLALAGSALADPPQSHRAQLAPPDLVERYVASGRGQPDLVERWVDGRASRPGLTPTSDATTSAGTRFGWSHAGAGALTGLVLTLAAAGGVLYLRRRDRRAHAPRPAV